MIKRILAVLLVIAVFTFSLPINALTLDVQGQVSAQDIERAMNNIAEATEKIKELSGAAEVSSAFKDFMRVAGYAGTALTAVNGSITFMRLIGIMDDPVKGGINNILDQLKTVNDKMNEMDSKLNSLANQMTKMEAVSEFNNRGVKAQSLYSSWKDFEYRYMEDGMDKLMTQYNGMVINGIKSWSANQTDGIRKTGNVDNTKIILIYVKDEQGNEQPLFFRGNEVPNEYKNDCRYVILNSDCLPQTFSFNVNDYKEKLTTDIFQKIKTALDVENYSAFESKNFDMFTSDGKEYVNDDSIKRVAEDAVSVLLYRIGSVEVNKDATFVLEAQRRFLNYCSHLFGSEDGIDAMLKTFYLTHSFEYEIKDDLADFLNRMILKTGTYGTFIANIEGMSDTTLDSAKLNSMECLCNAIDNLNSALVKGITGYDKYCYITNTLLQYTYSTVSGYVTVDTERVYKDKATYKSFRNGKIKVTTYDTISNEFTPIGDTNALVLIYTLQNNGLNTSLHEYLNKHITKYYVRDYGNILTSYSDEVNLPLDGSVKMKPFNIIGDDFNNKTSFNLTSNKDDYPDDAAPKYIVYHKKLCGSLYDTSTKELTSNNVLQAIAVYGQSHWYWFKDEAALFAGPSDYKYLETDLDSDSDGKFEYSDKLTSKSYYDTLIASPLPPRLNSDDRYDPLSSYRILSESLIPKNTSNVNVDEDESPVTSDRSYPTALPVITLISFVVFTCERKKIKV